MLPKGLCSTACWRRFRCCVSTHRSLSFQRLNSKTRLAQRLWLKDMDPCLSPQASISTAPCDASLPCITYQNPLMRDPSQSFPGTPWQQAWWFCQLPQGFTQDRCPKRPRPAQVAPRKNPNMLTEVQDPVPGPAPPPALQLLVLCVLQPAVMENHTDDALAGKQAGGAECGRQEEPRGAHLPPSEPGYPHPQGCSTWSLPLGVPQLPPQNPSNTNSSEKSAACPLSTTTECFTHTATCQTFCADEQTEAQKTSVSGQPGAQSLVHQPTPLRLSAVACPSPRESTGGNRGPLSLWGFSRTPMPLLTTTARPALRPHPPLREGERPQTYLDVLCVQILKVSQLPILQQPDFVRLTWRRMKSSLPVSECFQMWAHQPAASQPPQRQLWCPVDGQPVCLPPGWAKATPGNTPQDP